MEPINYPSWWNIHNDRLTHTDPSQPHGSGRALFGDWGRLGNVSSSTENDQLKSFFQFDGLLSLTNLIPPYYIDDFMPISKTEFDINPHLFIANRESTLNKYQHLRQIIKRVTRSKNNIAFQSYVDAYDRGVSEKHLKKLVTKLKIPLSLLYATEHYTPLFTDEKAMEVCRLSSPMYSGGCIKTFTLGGEVFVARCGGKSLGDIWIDKYESGSLTKVYRDAVGDRRPIFEIDYLILKNMCQLLIRRSDKISLVEVRIQDGEMKVDERDVICEGGPWLCARVNPRYAREIVCTSEDMINVYDVETFRVTWQKNGASLSPVVDSWNEMIPVLPMQWIHTTRAECGLVDMRLGGGAQNLDKELLSIKHTSFSDTESFVHTSALFDCHYFNVWSTYSGSMVDMRMPGRSVMQWTVPMVSPVSYSSHITRVGGDGVTLWVVGAQLEARHCVYEQQRDTHSVCASLASLDLCDEHAAISDRTGPMSLGLATVQDETSGVLSVLTLDHHGQVLCHQYSRLSFAAAAHHTVPRKRTSHCSVTNNYIDNQVDGEDVFKKCKPSDFEDPDLTPRNSSLEKVLESLVDRTAPMTFKNGDVFNL